MKGPNDDLDELKPKQLIKKPGAFFRCLALSACDNLSHLLQPGEEKAQGRPQSSLAVAEGA